VAFRTTCAVPSAPAAAPSGGDLTSTTKPCPSTRGLPSTGASAAGAAAGAAAAGVAGGLAAGGAPSLEQATAIAATAATKRTENFPE
jgi:hypothetical protein